MKEEKLKGGLNLIRKYLGWLKILTTLSRRLTPLQHNGWKDYIPACHLLWGKVTQYSEVIYWLSVACLRLVQRMRSTHRYYFSRQPVGGGITPSHPSQSEKRKNAREPIYLFAAWETFCTCFLILQQYHQPNRPVKNHSPADHSQHCGGAGKAPGSLPNVLLPSIRNEYIFPPFAMHLEQGC